MIRHHTPRIPSLCAGIGLIFAAASPLRSFAAQPAPQTAAASPSASSAKPDEIPADVLKTMTQVGDLDLLVTLTPLALNGTQIDKVVAVLESVKTSALDVAKLNYTALRSIAADVDTSRTAALKGTPVDDATKTHIAKTLTAIDKRTEDDTAASSKRVVTVLETALTPEQVKSIEIFYAGWVGGKITVPDKYKDDPDGKKAYVEETALGEYANRILLTQRAIDLLHKLRETAPAAPTASATTPVAGAPATTPGPATPAAP